MPNVEVKLSVDLCVQGAFGDNLGVPRNHLHLWTVILSDPQYSMFIQEGVELPYLGFAGNVSSLFQVFNLTLESFSLGMLDPVSLRFVQKFLHRWQILFSILLLRSSLVTSPNPASFDDCCC